MGTVMRFTGIHGDRQHLAAPRTSARGFDALRIGHMNEIMRGVARERRSIPVTTSLDAAPARSATAVEQLGVIQRAELSRDELLKHELRADQ